MAAKKKAAVEEVVVEATPVVEEAPKKKRTTRKKVTETVYVQFAGSEYEVASIVARVKEVYGAEVKDIKVYIKPEENMAYYVINGEETGSIIL